MIDQYKDFLLKNQQLNGSFGYSKQRSDIVEATIYSILALNTLNSKLPQIQTGINWLLTMQNNDGGWFLFDEDNSSSPYTTALSIITLYRVNKTLYTSYIQKGLNYLETVHYFFANEEMNKFTWGWNKGCFVGPEPTANVLLALKMLNSSIKFRLDESEKFFTSFICHNGGWTYGYPIDSNSPSSKTPCLNRLSGELNITAIALLALQDKKEKYFNNLELLLNEYAESYCPLSLSLSVLALNCYDQETSKVLERLNEIMTSDDFAKANVVYNALALLANLTVEGKNPLCLKI